ncbi:acyl-CoA N-acyltransferase [Hyaloraphidium curvatum]|nr:acyl-CoA N-acyltransferase [Hyaloraphidium curvatum]
MSQEPFLAPLERADGDILLRAYRPGDGPALRAAVTKSYQHLRPWMPWAKPEQTDAEAESTARKFCADYLSHREFVLGIWVGGELAGSTGFHLRGRDMMDCTAEIGMWIAADRAGQGLATRVLRIILEWGFSDEWPWRRLFWRCDARNKPSARVAEKGGLTFEGTMRSEVLDVEGGRADMMMFSMLREEWADRTGAGIASW